MKLYKETMDHLHFREDFCEATVQKAQNSEKKQRRLPRALPVAACICLSCPAGSRDLFRGSDRLRHYVRHRQHPLNGNDCFIAKKYRLPPFLSEAGFYFVFVLLRRAGLDARGGR